MNIISIKEAQTNLKIWSNQTNNYTYYNYSLRKASQGLTRGIVVVHNLGNRLAIKESLSRGVICPNPECLL